MANSLGYNDLAEVLNEIHTIVTGQKAIAPVNTSQFVNVATTTLMQGYDPVLRAISQVLGRTIFSIRPYYRKFNDLMKDSQQWGNHTRKLQMLDSSWDEDVTYSLVDGQTVDMYKIKTDAVLQTNFYGINNFARYITIWKHQLDTAFRGPDDFGQFISMKTQNLKDQIEQTFESVSRLTVANFMAGKLTVDPNSVVHLVTEYNDHMGTSFTTDTIRQPANWSDFVYWAFGRMASVSDMMTERLSTGHMQLKPPAGAKDGVLMRHTPVRNQRAFFLSSDLNQIGARVHSTTFHNDYLKMINHEIVNYWQSPETPAGIQVTPSYTGADGTIKVADRTVTLADVFGIIYDEECMGMTTVNQEMGPTPYNIKGSYSNMYAKYAVKWWNDWTENAVLFVLD